MSDLIPYAYPDNPDDYPEEWVVLEHSGTGTPGLLVVEWEQRTGEVRITGPVVVDNPPHAPAP